MKKTLIITKSYPSIKKPYAMSYVHSRCLEYKQKKMNFEVLSFDTTNNYQHEGIDVVTLDCAKKKIETYFQIVSHAPNLRQHIPFIIKHCKNKKIVLTFHGHEVIFKSRHYPKPYRFLFRNTLHSMLNKLINDTYDYFKLKTLKLFFQNFQITSFIFVSEHLRNLAEKDLNYKFPDSKTFIINNCANTTFITNTYKPAQERANDFITIRPLDNSTYCIDYIIKLALNHPDLSFTIYGQGSYFINRKPLNNLKIINHFIPQAEIPGLLSNFKAALMPTRHDTQGVMACEMATFGIPLITSDIKVCKEIFAEMPNVYFINNDTIPDLNKILNKIASETTTPNKVKFNHQLTTHKEIGLLLKNDDINHI